ncbi:hypothetical protein AAGS61_11585 [Lysinibacillus sp. KU-BSD001]|uniref:hypothetical protein n=1 Tax=Lysinibacillus sp. KU-BSD001 TaxID=3141328 RepID=UPI0036E9FC06
MKDSVACLIIGGIVLSVSIVLLLLHYIVPGIILFSLASILFVCSSLLVRAHGEHVFDRRSRI